MAKFKAVCPVCGEEKIISIPKASSKSQAKRILIQLEDEEIFKHECGRFDVRELIKEIKDGI